MSEIRNPFPGELQKHAEHMYEQVFSLRSMRENFRRFDRVVRSKPHGVDGEFHRWIMHMYTHTLCLSLRRLVDDDERTHSLRNLMDDIRERANEFTRERWLAAWMHGVLAPRTPDNLSAADRAWLEELSRDKWKKRAEEYFDKFAPDGRPDLDPAGVAQDEAELVHAMKVVQAMVNSYIAHDSKKKPQRLPTWGELDATIDLAVRMVEKYYSLFHQTFPSNEETLDAWKNRPGFPFPDSD